MRRSNSIVTEDDCPRCGASLFDTAPTPYFVVTTDAQDESATVWYHTECGECDWEVEFPIGKGTPSGSNPGGR